MALRPMIVIGCGGSGGKVVLGLRKRMTEELERRGWTQGIPSAIQFKWIDVPSDPEREPDFGPPLPLGDYIPLSTTGDYADYDRTLVFKAGQNRMDRLTGWRPTPHLTLPVTEGAGQMRGVGRGVALAKANVVADAVRNALGSVASGRASLELLAAHLRGGAADESAPAVDSSEPFVVVISSLAGGTGAGIFVDVCDLVRASQPSLSNRIFGVLFTAEVFRDVRADSGMPSNTVAALSELMAGYLAINRSPESLFGVAGTQGTQGMAGPAYPFIVGLQPLGGGAPLASPGECYRAVTETLLATMLDEQLQQDFLAHEVTNYIPNAGTNTRKSPFAMINESPGSNVPARCGVVSSFGSAKVSVGSARFGNWAQDRMARAVVDYVVSGWRERGLEFFDKAKRETATDIDIVEFLVARDREVFISRCGLYEENEPDGTKHDDVLEGILDTATLARIVAEARTKLIGELQAAGDQNATKWVQLVSDAVRMREGQLATAVAVAIDEGAREFAKNVVPSVSSAVSEWLARFGLPVTSGLVAATRDQCNIAAAQLDEEAAKAGEQAAQDALPSITAAFQPLGNGKCASGSDYVLQALRRALGPASWRSQRARCEATSALLTEVVTKVLDPLLAELSQVGRDLTHPTFVDRVKEWPDGPGVSELYKPPPSEFCLVPDDQWDAKYTELLSPFEEGANGVRDLIGAGGFMYGPPANRRTAPVAVQFSQENWFGRDARQVNVTLALRPNDVLERTKLWFGDDGHAMGRFLRTGLDDYLKREGREGLVPDHLDRLDRFRVAVAGAAAMAQPLFRVSEPVLQMIHPGSSLKVSLSVQKFPFSPDHPARAIVDTVLHGEAAPTGGWCSASSTDGVESVLMMSRLASAIHPAAVASLYQPIAKRWNEVITEGTDPTASIDGFWTFNRARLLTEAIPLPQPSIDAIIRGWFVGRLLGLITAPTISEPMTVRTTDQFGAPKVATLPWPLLRHGKQRKLHQDSYRLEWLPALLEHIGLAMMLVSQQPHILDGYEMMFKLGQDSSDILSTWIRTGDTPAGRDQVTQVRGSSPDERKANVVTALTSLRDVYMQRSRDTESKLVDNFETFMTVPYGFELISPIVTQLAILEADVANQSTESEFG
jgi:hypothetical protein